MTDDTNSAPVEIHGYTVHEKLLASEDLLLLDCREPAEYELVHLSNATLLPMNELPARIGELKPYHDNEIIVYCHHGMRSLQVATWLREQGFPQAKSMSGGIDQWAQEIDPSLLRY